MGKDEDLNVLYNVLPTKKWKILDSLVGRLEAAEANNAKHKKMAFYDELTGLGNRRLLGGKLREEASRLSRKGDRYAVVEFDIDNFGNFNNKYGHDIGDEALCAFSDSVSNNIRPSDGFYRHGGEEFYLVLSGIKDKRQAHRIVSDLMNKIREVRVDVGGAKDVGLTASAGIYLPKNGDSRDEVLKKADLPMYEAKKNGRNQSRVYFGNR